MNGPKAKRVLLSLQMTVWAAVVRCTSPIAVEDPIAALRDPGVGPRQHLGAMLELDRSPGDPQYLAALHEVLWNVGYLPGTREQALERLAAHDVAGLKREIRNRLPNLGARAWQERLCELIADRGWTDLSPAIVSAWARPIRFVDDFDRVEYATLVRLHGPDHVIDTVYQTLVDSTDRPFLRTRSWELLIRLGEDRRLRQLLADTTVGPDDPMLADLRGAAVDLGVFPRTREEILWVRALRDPARAEFYSQAAAVVCGLDAQRLAGLEVRDLPALVAASVHDPRLLRESPAELRPQVESRLKGARHHLDPRRYEGHPGTYGERLADHADELTWGDLAAMLLALRAVAVPQVADHLFDYAERDRADESCEYGGVITLDSQGRFEVLEFPPRFRRHDNEFIASQAMLDAGYTALFHFHLHAQRHRNDRYAGPGTGDLAYADNMRANCLVLTFLDAGRLNVDFYRHGHVIVDLGEVARP
jgi:hypothetical protein